MRRVIFVFLCGGLALSAVACGGGAPATELPPAPTTKGLPPLPPIEGISPGQGVFMAQKCGQCHVLGGVGKGMDLSKVGAKHDKAWIAEHIRDARKHTPNSKMHQYPEDKLSAKDLDTLAEHLAGQK